MLEQKNDEKMYFFRAGQWAALSSFRVGTKITKGCRSKRVGILIYYTGNGYFLTGHSEKGYQFQNVEHTIKGKFCGPLFTHRYTVDQQAPPGQ